MSHPEGHDATLVPRRIVGFEGHHDPLRTPAWRTPIHDDANGHLMLPGGHTMPWREGDAFPGEATAVGPWPAGDDVIVVLSRTRASVLVRGHNGPLPPAVRRYLDWCLSNEPSDLALRTHRDGPSCIGAIPRSDAPALREALRDVARDELRAAVRGTQFEAIRRAAWVLQRSALNDDDRALVLEGLRHGHEHPDVHARTTRTLFRGTSQERQDALLHNAEVFLAPAKPEDASTHTSPLTQHRDAVRSRFGLYAPVAP